MKTLRTVFATVACICLLLFGTCFLLVYLDSDILQRTVFYIMQRTRFVFLILALSFFVICIIASLALRKLDKDPYEDDFDLVLDDEEEERSYNKVPVKKVRPNEKSDHVKLSQDKKRHLKESSEEMFDFDDCVSVGAEYSPVPSKIQQRGREVCPNCGASLSKNSRFCELCGYKI